METLRRIFIAVVLLIGGVAIALAFFTFSSISMASSYDAEIERTLASIHREQVRQYELRDNADCRGECGEFFESQCTLFEDAITLNYQVRQYYLAMDIFPHAFLLKMIGYKRSEYKYIFPTSNDRCPLTRE